jgi:hypothetical protein
MAWVTDTVSTEPICPESRTWFFRLDEKSFLYTAAFGTGMRTANALWHISPKRTPAIGIPSWRETAKETWPMRQP